MQQRYKRMEKHEWEDIPQIRKGLPETRKEQKEKVVSQISRDPDSYFLALHSGRGKTLRGSAVAAWHPGDSPWTQQRSSEPQQILEVKMSQHLKGSWGQRHRMSQLRDRWPITRGTSNFPHAPDGALSQAWNTGPCLWGRGQEWGQFKGGTFRMAE